MSFTDRFIKVPIKLYNVQEKELLDKKDYDCEQLDSFKKILPMRIESYERAMPAGDGFGADKFTALSINMVSGDSFLAYISIEDFENLLNSQE